MTWQTEMVTILRYLIDDINSVIYNDTRLETTITVSAQLIQVEVDFDKTYTIDVEVPSITPDPTATTQDNGFINLVVLKAACIILSGEAKAKALEAIKIVDGPTTIDTSQRHKALEERAQKMCAEYAQARIQYMAGNSRAGQSVITPFIWELIGSDVDRNFN